LPSQWERTRRAYDFLRQHQGQIVSDKQIADAAGWSPVSVRTYAAKKWSDLLVRQGAGTYRVQGFADLSWEAFRELQTQTTRPPAPSFEYELALSFAGEDRAYVETIAALLQAYGVRFFFDENEQAALWGKELTEELDDVYRNRARYCLMFVSAAYANKAWPTQERRSALARPVEEGEEYILAIRLDDSTVPGLRPSVAYIDSNSTSPEEIARLVLKKLGLDDEIKDFWAFLSDIFGVGEPDGYLVEQAGDVVKFELPREDFTAEVPLAVLLAAHRTGYLDWMAYSSIWVW